MPLAGPIHAPSGRYYPRLNAYASIWMLPTRPLLVEAHLTPSLYQRSLDSSVGVLQAVLEGGLLRADEPVLGVCLKGGQLSRQAGEVAGRIPGYVLRVLRAHLRTEHPTPPRPLYALLSTWGIGAGPR